MSSRWMKVSALVVALQVMCKSCSVLAFVTNPLFATKSVMKGGSPNAAEQSTLLRMADTTTNKNSAGGSSSELIVEEASSRAYVGTIGNWEEIQGNFILRPPVNDGQPRALLHFLGGALVGAAPHISYRYMLEKLAERGYLIVATPYNLSFDHLESCDTVISSFERIAPMLARQYGAVPVVGVGHSCGALLQLLITSLFPDTPRAANALLSFNNKPVKEAVPFFDEVFTPLFTTLAAKNETYPSGTEAMNIGLQLAKSAIEGELPSDDVLQRITKFLVPPGLSEPYSPENVAIPAQVRDAVATILEPSTKALSNAGVAPVMHQVVEALEQIPLLVDEVAVGARDFTPTPSSVRAAARRAYRARRTLILQYDNDPLDESDELEELLVEAEKVTRMKRPMIEIDLQKTTLEGGHAAPLLAPPVDLATRAEDILGQDTAKERLLYQQADATVEELVRWLEESSL